MSERPGSPEPSSSGEFLALAERILGFGVWTWDGSTETFRCSDELFRIFGLDAELANGDTEAFLSLMSLEKAEESRQAVRDADDGVRSFDFESRITRPGDDEERFLYTRGEISSPDDGKPFSVFGITYDVTVESRVERNLGYSEKRLRGIVENIPSLVVVKNLDGRYVMANPIADDAARVEPGGVLGLGTLDAFPDVGSVQLRRDEEVARTGEPIHVEETWVRDGEERIYRSVTFPLKDEDGRVVETCTIATDATELAEREAEERTRQDWDLRLESALTEERLLVYSQPIIDLASGEVDSHEWLIRMREQDRIVAPDEFIPAAEELGLIQKVDLWMFEQARSAEHPVHLNVSAVTLDDAASRDRLVELLSDGTPGNVVIEITETASLEKLHSAQEFAEAARALGCRIALDDFGVGFGSFTYLRSLPVDYVKIDRKFISGLAESADNRRLVEGIVGLARGLGVETVAEGVEDAHTCELLRSAGVDLVQGYHFGRPAPLET